MKLADLVGVLPRNWERAFGYDGDARCVAFYWTSLGDEAMYDDGRVAGDGNWRLFLTLRYQYPELDRRYNVGYSDLEADHWLLLDRETHDLVVMRRAEAQARLRLQWTSLDANAKLTSFEWDVIQEAVQQAWTTLSLPCSISSLAIPASTALRQAGCGRMMVALTPAQYARAGGFCHSRRHQYP